MAWNPKWWEPVKPTSGPLADRRGNRSGGGGGGGGTTPQAPQSPPPANNGLANSTWTAPPADPGNGGGGWNNGWSGGGGDGGASAALAKANQEGKERSRRENEATYELVRGQVKLLKQHEKQRDTKLGNITEAVDAANKLLIKTYGSTLTALMGNKSDNEKAEGASSFSNIANALRERGDIMTEAAANGAGETDILRSQLAALRNYSTNQNETNRSFFDTQRSVNNSITSLNSDTETKRSDIWNTAEADREKAWADYYNQSAETYTQILNLENSNTNIDSDSSEAFQKSNPTAGDVAAKMAGSSYKKKKGKGLDKWDGKGSTEDRGVTSSNRSATIYLGKEQKAPEGASLRKW